MSIIRYGGTSGGYRAIKQFGRDPFLGYTLEDLAQLVKGAGGVLYLDARKADGVQKGVNAPFTNPLIDLTKLGNNATLTNFAATQTDGYTLEATVNSNGQAVGYSNLVVNGDFAQGQAPWTTEGGLATISSGQATITGNGLANLIGIVQQTGFKPSNKRVARRVRVRVLDAATSIQVVLRDGNGGTQYNPILVSNPVVNQWYELELEAITTFGTLTNNMNIFIRAFYTDNATQNGKRLQVEKVQIINLDDNPQITAFETNQLQKPLDALACDRIFPFVATTGTTLVSARPYLATEGLDSLGVLANNPSVDIVGLEEFEFAWCGITPSTLQDGYLISKGLDSAATSQLAVNITPSGSVIFRMSGATALIVASDGTIKTNTSYDLRIVRIGGRLKCWLNGVLIYDQPNTVSLTSQPNLRLFARSNNASGTTHNIYFKGLTAYLILARGTYGDLDKLDGVLDKVARDYR